LFHLSGGGDDLGWRVQTLLRLFQQGYLTFGLMYQFTVNLGTNRHFYQVVIYITYDPRGGTEFHSLAGDYVAPNDAVKLHIWDANAALNGSIANNSQQRLAFQVGFYVAINGAIHMATAQKIDISINF
jgi:hypothetical protein